MTGGIKMKQRIPALLLAVLLLLACLPTGALAAETGYFYFSAETSTQLVAEPARISYTAGQTILEALQASGYVFTTTSGGFISAIDGVTGNYTYGSTPANYSLNDPASGVTHFRFSEGSDSTPSAGLQQLMREMAEYRLEAEDVRNAAKDAYDTALANYCGVSDTAAAAYAKAISDAIADYKNSQGTAYTVTFSGYSDSQYAVSAENQYGKVFRDESHTGSLSLPAGTYTFFVRNGNLQVSGEITVSGSMTVSAALPEGGWFDEDSFQLSSGYDADFEDNRYSCTVENHTVTTLVPDSFTGRLYPYFELTNSAAVTAIYTDANGAAREKSIPAKSKAISIDNALANGAEGNTVILRASLAGSDGYIQSEDLTLQLDRMPTLSALHVTDSAGTAQAATEAFSDTKLAYTYRIVTTDSLKIYPTAANSSYTVKVNGTSLSADGSVTVPISGETVITVTVSSGVYETNYVLTVLPGAGKQVTFTMDADVSIEVVNQNDEVLEYTRKFEGSKVIYSYTLVPGETYSYVATKDTYYHAKKSFTLLDSSDSASNFEVSVAAGDWLTDLALGSASTSTYRGSILLSSAFSQTTHAYTATVSDASNAVYLWATVSKGSCTAFYPYHSTARDSSTNNIITITSGKLVGTILTQVLLPGSAYENTVTVRVSYDDSAAGVTYYTDYVVKLERTLSLKNMTVSCQGSSVTLNRDNSESTGYHRSETAYSVLVPAAASSLELTLQTHTDTPKYGDTDNGYEIAVNGEPVSASGTATVALSGTETTETVKVTLTNRYNTTAKTEYQITVKKAPTIAVTFNLQPAGTLVYLYETVTGNRVWPDADGSYALSEGFTYFCSLTKNGYVGQSGTMAISSDSGTTVLTFGDRQFQNPGNVSITLQEAPENAAIDSGMDSEWADFRGTAYSNGVMTGGKNSNNCVTDVKTPIVAEDGTLYWAVKLGDGYSSDAVSSPILVDNCLIVYAGENLYRVDKDTGAILKTGTMAGKSSFAINSPTYCDGIILVGLSDGRIQAFNADTLESLWIYTDPLGGQPNCPITVCNGYAYTGFWKGEDKETSFVCVSLTDEDPTSATEAKNATWRHVQDGGFYWAGAYACEDFVMVGTDDGAAGCSYLYLFDPLTGAVLDSRNGFNGDIRSTVSYDASTNAYYFTSKGGSFYCATVGEQDGSYRITDCKELKLNNGADDPANPPMSTSTPVVYNGRAYIGVSGTGQFSAYSGHNITVIDLASWSIAYTVPTQGYPQTSGLLTTAYESTGYVYVYFFDNYTPGTLRVLRDKAGQTAADYVTKETYSGTSYQTPYAVFTPAGDQAQYAICSPIADANGTIYFKNDSAYLMAFGSAISSLEVTTQPSKTVYQAGETFSKDGMVVTATLANGLTRDVTAMMSAPEGTLTDGTTEVTLQLGRGQTMYHNQSASGGTMQAGVTTTPLTVTVSIRVGESAALWGDVNGDGKVDSTDAVLLLRYAAKLSVTIDTSVADVSGDGKIDSTDVVLILRYAAKLISKFPVEE